MKGKFRMLLVLIAATILNAADVSAQKFDQERMDRDIAVSENVLVTLIKQQFVSQRTFFQLEVRGSYQAGYGVTFTLPADYTTPIVFQKPGDDMIWSPQGGALTISSDGGAQRS